MKGSKKRIVIGFVFPLVIADIILTIYSGMVFEGDRLPGAAGFFKQFILEGLIYAFVYVLVLGGVQSLVYSLIMEKIINAKLQANILVIFASAILGIVSAALAGFATNQLLQFSVLGMLVGIVVGVLLRAMYLKERKLLT